MSTGSSAGTCAGGRTRAEKRFGQAQHTSGGVTAEWQSPLLRLQGRRSSRRGGARASLAKYHTWPLRSSICAETLPVAFSVSSTVSTEWNRT